MTALQIIEAAGPPRFKTKDVRECRDYIKDSTGTHNFDLGRTSYFVDFAHLPNARMVSFTKCGHWVQWEKADAFNSIVPTFLAEENGAS